MKGMNNMTNFLPILAEGNGGGNNSMSMILMIHTVDSCKEYVLPGLYNSDFSIVLPKDTFGFSKDITLYMGM